MKTKTKILKKHPRLFRSLTGLTPERFDRLLKELDPLYIKAEEKRKNRKSRIRKIGGGNTYKLSLEDRLLMLLIYYRTYMTHELLEFMFGIHNSNVSRRINQLNPILAKIFKIPERKIRLTEKESKELTDIFRINRYLL